jgi:hypothetical protein
MAQVTGPSRNPETVGPISVQKGWADIGPTYFLSPFLLRPGQTQPNIYGPAQVRDELIAEREQ